MLIDWFTVAAQIINFLILIFLLRRFLYGPIVNAMHERQQRVLAHLHDAEEQRAAAEQAEQQYRQQQQEFEQQRARLLNEAQQAADERRRVLTQEARQEVAALQQGWQQTVQQGKQAFLRDLRQRTSAQVVAIARRVLADLADADLEQRIHEVFLARLQQLGEEERATLQRALNETHNQATIQSAFAIPPTQQQQIDRALQQQFGTLTLEFVTLPELLCGISFKVGGHEVAWSLQSYLETLEEMVARTFDEESHTEQPAAVEQV